MRDEAKERLELLSTIPLCTHKTYLTSYTDITKYMKAHLDTALIAMKMRIKLSLLAHLWDESGSYDQIYSTYQNASKIKDYKIETREI